MYLRYITARFQLDACCIVPTFKIIRIECAQPGTRLFANLHANENPSRVIHERIVQAHTSLGTVCCIKMFAKLTQIVATPS